MYTTEFVDITPAISHKQLPIVRFPYHDGDVWRVRNKPYELNEITNPPKLLDWTLVRGGVALDIPLMAYLTLDKEPPHVGCFLLDLATRYAFSIPERPLRVHWVIGTPWVDKPNGFEIWIGTAYLVNSKR